MLCKACKDGHHKYCTSDFGDSDCTCEATKKCKENNWRRRSENDTAKRQRGLYEKALTGDIQAIKRLMKARRDYEYESVWEIDVIDPLEPEEEE